jgi:hypothetical protein
MDPIVEQLLLQRQRRTPPAPAGRGRRHPAWSLGASGTERGFYLRMGYTGRARLRKQLPLPSAVHQEAEERRRDLEELRQRRQRRLAARQP